MIRAEVVGVSLDVQHQPVVILRHEDRVLAIMVGPNEAEAIHIALIERDFGRPLTHDLICNLLAGLHAELDSIHIYKLENNIFYAYLNITQKNAEGQVEQVLRVDTRPSDGMAIACRTHSPIFVAEEVMDMASQDISVLGSADDDDSDESGEEPGFEE